MRLILVLILLSGLLTACGRSYSGKTQPLLENGALDLQGWNFEKDGPVSLKGQWEFYWNQLLYPQDFAAQPFPQKSGLFKMPGAWNGYELEGKKLPGEGYATFRLLINLAPDQKFLALHCPELGNAYRLYVNGKLLSSNGRVAVTPGDMIPAWIPGTVSLAATGEPLDILLQISNFHHQFGGSWLPLTLGKDAQIFEARERTVALELFMVGSLIIMGLYHLGIFFIRRKERAPLYFGLYCLLIGIRNLVTGEMFLAGAFPNAPWELFVKLSYLSFYIGLPMISSFLERVFPQLIHKRFIWLIWLLSLLVTLLVLIFPARVYSYTLQPYQAFSVVLIIYFLYSLLVALYRKMEGAGLFFLGSLVLGVTVINDILFLNFLSPVGNLTSLGFLFFIFFQAYLLSTRSSRAFSVVEELTEKMEAKVLERTQELEAGRRQLEGLSAVTRRVSEAGDLPSVLTAVHDALVDHLGPMGVWLLLVDKERGELYTNSYRPIPGTVYSKEQDRFLNEFRVPLKWESGTLFRTYARKRTLLVNRPVETPFRYLDVQIAQTLGFRSFAQMPVIVQNEVIGILAITGPGLVSRAYLPWLKLFADQTAGAVYLASLLARTQQARGEILELNEFSKKLNSTTDLNEHLDYISSYVRKNYPIEGVMLLRTDLELQALVHLYLSAPEHLHEFARAIQVPLEEQGGIIYRTFRRKKPFYVSSGIIKRDVFRKTYPGMELDRGLIEHLQLSSFLLVPLNVRDQVIGMAMFTSWKEHSQLSRSDIASIVRFCEQIAGDLYASSLLKDIRDKHQARELARAEAQGAVSEIEQLNRLARRINENVDINAILDDVFAYFKSAFRIDGCVLYLYEPGANELYALKYSESLQRFEVEEQPPEMQRFVLTPQSGSLYSVFFRRKSLHVRDTRKYLHRAGMAEQDRLILKSLGANDILEVPLVIQNQSIGIFCLTRLDEPMHLSKAEIRSIERACRQIAGAIHSKSLFKQDQDRSRELARANQKLQHMDRAKTRFFANISHEFRTPLTLILAPVESLLKGDYGETISKSHSVFKSLLQNGVRLLGLINNLLDFTSIEAGRMAAAKQKTDLVELLEYFKTSVVPTAEAKGLDVVFTYSCESLLACVDRELLEKAVMNLLSNAFKFTGPGGEITVHLEDTDETEFALSVTDSGIGVPSDKLETIFERFRQVEESTSRSYEGTGIGLSLTKEIVELHGGSIDVQSTPGAGTAFTLLIPKGNIHGDEEPAQKVEVKDHHSLSEFSEAPGRLVESQVSEASGPREHQILIVEDNADMRSFLLNLLEPIYTVHRASDGRMGLAKAMKLRPDLVLSDVMMPKMDGYEMTQKLKRNGSTRDIPVILLSARAEVTHRIEGLEFGADDYLSKPFNSEELLARIRNQIESRKLEKELQQENAEIDQAQRRASQIQKNILTPRSVFEQIPGLEIELAYLPMDGQVSGDYYNISPLKNGMASVFMADTTGHGTQAALSTMQIDLLYRDNLKLNSPARRFETINNKFVSELHSINFFTGINVDIFSDKIRYSSAGHPEQYLIRVAGAEIKSLKTRGGMIGMLEEQTFGMEEIQIDKGDVLLLFSDGLFEVFNDKQEEFGEQRFLTLIQNELEQGVFSRPMPEVTARVMESVVAFKDEEPFWDDITLIGVRLK